MGNEIPLYKEGYRGISFTTDGFKFSCQSNDRQRSNRINHQIIPFTLNLSKGGKLPLA